MCIASNISMSRWRQSHSEIAIDTQLLNPLILSPHSPADQLCTEERKDQRRLHTVSTEDRIFNCGKVLTRTNRRTVYRKVKCEWKEGLQEERISQKSKSQYLFTTNPYIGYFMNSCLLLNAKGCQHASVCILDFISCVSGSNFTEMLDSFKAAR